MQLFKDISVINRGNWISDFCKSVSIRCHSSAWHEAFCLNQLVYKFWKNLFTNNGGIKLSRSKNEAVMFKTILLLIGLSRIVGNWNSNIGIPF